MKKIQLLIDKEKAKGLSELGLKIDEPETNIFVASESDLKKFRDAWRFIYIATEEIILDEIVKDEERAEGSGTQGDGDMTTHELLDIFGISGDTIQTLQKQYSDFPIKGLNGSYSARQDELKRWINDNPGILHWSDLHFRYDGKAV